MVRLSRDVCLWLTCCAVSLTVSATVEAEPLSLVMLNNQGAAVTFNDGDSFRVVEGPYTNTRARLSGFNTLESHGPVHKWGGWHYKEMYALAKLGTLNARRGKWHCESPDLSTDGYGRILWFCPDLGADQIRKGYAHAMTVTEDPADPRLLAAQHEAIRYRRGMWAKGIPTYILTSAHSSLSGEGRAHTYNRLVNTVDGHSKPWLHTDAYTECQPVCHEPLELPQAEALKVVSEMRANSTYQNIIAGIDDILVALSINTYIQNGIVPKIFGANNDAFLKACQQLAAQGRFSMVERIPGSCFINVHFKRRYARPKPACLKW